LWEVFTLGKWKPTENCFSQAIHHPHIHPSWWTGGRIWVTLRPDTGQKRPRKGNTSAGGPGRKEGWVQARFCGRKSQASQVGTAMDKKTDHHLSSGDTAKKEREREREREISLGWVN
jgi:bacillopeptidase F (M6 metalloprotease family)